MNERGEISLLKWLQRYWIGIFLSLIAIYFPLQSAVMSMLEQRTEENVHRCIEIAESGIETSLGIVDSFLNESLYNSTTQSTSQLYHAIRYEEDPLALHAARRTVLNSLQSITSFSDMIDFIVVYTDREDAFLWLEAGDENNYLQRKYIKDLISGSIDQGSLSRYATYRTPAGNCMIRYLKIEGSYLAVSVSGEKMIRSLLNVYSGVKSIAYVAEADGNVLFASEDIPVCLSPDQEGTYVRINGVDYLQSGHLSPTTGYYFGILTEKSGIMSDVWLFRTLFWGVFLILVVTMPLFFHVIQNNVEKPVAEMVKTMNAISEGDLALTVAENVKIRELRQLAKAFNHMLQKIETLKIEKYEVQLEMQKATMQYLQLQIKPHFYVNLLNIVYSLAEQKDFAMIQKVSHTVVCYSRYMFRDASELVELRREIEHVQYYMEIQQIRYNKSILCEIHIPEEIQSAQVPPFVIQSFVENSVKYALRANGVCRISIFAKTDDKKENLKLCIQDNGSGYSQDYLNRDWERKGEAGHIGLANVRQRLKLIFGDKAEIVLGNDGGAVARITMPYISVEDMDLED